MRRSNWLGVAVITLLAAGSAAASPASGRWRTAEDGGVVEVSDCGVSVCGRVVSSKRIVADPMIKDVYNKNPALRDRLIKGVALFEDMHGGPAVWKGRVYNPADGGTYSGTVTLIDAGTLKLRGCIIFPLCKTQTWTRLR